MPLYTGPEIPDNHLRVIGSSDPSKKLALEVDGLTTATTRTLTPQDASYTIAGLETNQDFTGVCEFSNLVGAVRITGGGLSIGELGVNTGSIQSFVEFSSPGEVMWDFTDVAGGNSVRLVTSTIVGGQEVQFPNASGIFVLDTATQTLTNKTLGAASSNDDIVGAQINAWAETGSGNNDFLRINDTSSLSSSGFTFTLAYTTPTANRRLTFPNATGQIVLTSSTDVLSNKTLAGTGGIRCGTSTSTGVKFQNVTSTTQIMMIDLSELTTQRNIKFLDIAGTVALDTNHVVDSSGNILVDSSGNLVLST